MIIIIIIKYAMQVHDDRWFKFCIPYRRKLNLVVEPKIVIARISADLNLAVVIIDCQTTKFNSPPNFPAIRYFVSVISLSCR